MLHFIYRSKNDGKFIVADIDVDTSQPTFKILKRCL